MLLVFKYIVQAGDNDIDGIGVPGPHRPERRHDPEVRQSATNDVALDLGNHKITNDADHLVTTPKPTVTISTTDTEIDEGDDITITVTRDSTAGASSFTVNLGLSVVKTEDNSNANPFDWPANASASATVDFADGAATVTATLSDTNDKLAGGDHRVTITLKAGHSYAVGSPNSVSVTVRDDESLAAAAAIVSITPQDRAMLVAWSPPADLGRVDGVAVNSSTGSSIWK